MNNRKMKNRYSILALLMLMLTGCNFLDFDESTGYVNQEDMFKYFDLSEQMLTHVYWYLDQDFGAINGAMRDCATDDAYYVWSNNPVHTFTNGSWSAINTVDAEWGNNYSGIRAANQFIDQIAKTDYTRFKWNSDYESWVEKSQYWAFEARFLRAQFTFELARRYGDIPLIEDKILTVDEVNSLTKTNFAQVIAYIVSECDAIMEALPENYANVTGKETGRITKGAVMALKARALTYAASPLHNDANSVQLWKDAAAASSAIISSNLYSLVSMSKVNDHDLSSADLILERRNASSVDFEARNTPAGYDKGNTGTCPTQNLVDAFQTINGYDVVLTAIGWQSADPSFDATQPFANRDPRFEATVLCNGAIWLGLPVESFIGGRNGYPLEGATPTGYYLRKLMHKNVALSPNEKKQNHFYPIYRYAEVVLNYAEAMNEAFNSPTYTDATYSLSALDALNQIRANAGLPAVNAGLTKAEMREVIRRERRVELAFENHRFWDVRRWKIGSETQKNVRGVEITKKADASLEYKLIKVEDRFWDEKMNLYPIPQNELYINNNLFPQNLGW